MELPAGRMLSARLWRARYAVAAALLLGALLLFSPRGIFANVREDIALLLTGSSELAYEYGEKHFRSEEPRSYDIERAKELFERARAANPDLPYVNHQLARIAFLGGDFGRAVMFSNQQIRKHGDAVPASYYVRGLIRGFSGDYDEAAEDYEAYLASDPYNWAALNDYAWVLLKGDHAEEALKAAEKGLERFPENPWLLNSSAIALYELGEIVEAYEQVKKAAEHSSGTTEEEWLTAYPGNDPQVAEEGIAALRASILENMATIEERLASSGTSE